MWNLIAEKALRNEAPTKDEAKAVLEAPDSELLPILQAALKVRERFHGRRVRLHVLENAKSGACPEDCAFCAQSSRYTTPADKYPLETVDEIVAGAARAKAAHAWKYCIVTATRGPSPRDLDTICEAVRQIKQTVDIKICTSLGILNEESAKRLAEAGAGKFKPKLENQEGRYRGDCANSTYRRRLRTADGAKRPR